MRNVADKGVASLRLKRTVALGIGEAKLTAQSYSLSVPPSPTCTSCTAVGE